MADNNTDGWVDIEDVKVDTADNDDWMDLDSKTGELSTPEDKKSLLTKAYEGYEDFSASIDPLGLGSRIGALGQAGIEMGVEAFGGEGIYPGKQSFGEAYDEAVKATRLEKEQRQARSPILSTVGEIASDVMLPVPGLGGAAGVAARIGTEAGYAATRKGAEAIEGEIAGVEGTDFGDVGTEAGVTAGIQAGLEAIPVVGKAVGKLAKEFIPKSKSKAFDALIPTSGDVKNIKQPERDEIGDILMKKDIFKSDSGVPLSRAKASEKLGAVKEDVGSEIGTVYDDLEEIHGFYANTSPKLSEALSMSKTEFIGDINKRIGELNKNPGNMPTIRKMKRFIKDVEASDLGETLTPKTIKEIRSAIDKQTNFASDAVSQNANKEIRSIFRGQEDSIIKNSEDILSKAVKDQTANASLDSLKKLNKDYGNLSTAEEILEKTVAKDETASAIGLGSIGLGGLGTMVDPVIGGMTILGREVWKRYGNQATALGIDATSKLFKEPKYSKYASQLAKAAKKSNAALALTHQLLQKDPEYKKALKE